MDHKTIDWIGSSRDDIRSFPSEVRRKAGFELRALQRREKPTDFRRIDSVGNGVYEIRVHVHGAYRIFYIASFEEAIYVLHAFQKKTQKTAKRDIEVDRQRYRIAQRKHQETQA
jgi:phage-related protein